MKNVDRALTDPPLVKIALKAEKMLKSEFISEITVCDGSESWVIHESEIWRTALLTLYDISYCV